MDDLKNFIDFNEQIFQVQRENELTDLYNIPIEGKTTATAMSDILGRKNKVHDYSYSIFKIHDEFIAISKDIKYVTGILFFLKPYIINTEEFGGKYFQNLPDRRYLVYSTFALQSVYNFWDRLGDLLYLFFPTNLKSKNVYFGRVFDQIGQEYKSTEPYFDLKIYHDEIKSILNLRHDTVHHFQIETLHYWGNIQHSNNEDERNKLNAEKFTYPNKLKRALEISNLAFIAALNLIDELPDKSNEPL